jgi:hypothetical protein
MKLFIVHRINHAHISAINVFDDQEKALTFAKLAVFKFNRFPTAIEEEEVKGYLYFCHYSSEGDNVSVQEVVLNDDTS